MLATPWDKMQRTAKKSRAWGAAAKVYSRYCNPLSRVRVINILYLTISPHSPPGRNILHSYWLLVSYCPGVTHLAFFLSCFSHFGSQTISIFWHRQTEGFARSSSRPCAFQVLFLCHELILILHGQHNFLLHCTNSLSFILLNSPSKSLLVTHQTANHTEMRHWADKSETQPAQALEGTTTSRAPEEECLHRHTAKHLLAFECP